MLAFIVILAALLFGAVEVWSAAAVMILVFGAGLLWSIINVKENSDLPEHIGKLFVVALIFCAYIGIQLIPLPAAVVSFISPATAQTRDFYRIAATPFMTLSFDPYLTIHELHRTAAFFMVFFIASTIFADREKLTKMVIVLLVFGFCLAIFAIVQKATWNNKIYWFRELTMGGHPFGPFVNRNHFAGFIGMLVPLGLGYTLTRHYREKKIFFGFLTVIMAVSLFLSLSRGGVISFCASMALFSMLVVITRVETRRMWAVAAFLIIVATYLVNLGIDPVIDRFSETDLSKEQRIIVWQSAWAGFGDFWFTGSGLGTFIDIFHLYSPASVQSIYDHAHNDYLEYMLETGAIGIALLLAFAGLLLYPYTKTDLKEKSGMMRIAVISSVFSMMIHSIFDFNLHILSNMLLFAVVLGMLCALSLSGEDKYHKRKAKGQGLKGIKPESDDSELTVSRSTQNTLFSDETEAWEKEIRN